MQFVIRLLGQLLISEYRAVGRIFPIDYLAISVHKVKVRCPRAEHHKLHTRNRNAAHRIHLGVMVDDLLSHFNVLLPRHIVNVGLHVVSHEQVLIGAVDSLDVWRHLNVLEADWVQILSQVESGLRLRTIEAE